MDTGGQKKGLLLWTGGYRGYFHNEDMDTGGAVVMHRWKQWVLWLCTGGYRGCCGYAEVDTGVLSLCRGVYRACCHYAVVENLQPARIQI